MTVTTGNEFNNSYLKWGNTNPQFNISPGSIAGGGLTPQAAYSYSGNYGSPGGNVIPAGASTVGSGFNWGTAGNAMGAIQAGFGIYNNIMDILGKSDADKQRQFAKTFTMREWNTKARQHDNMLQMGRNKVAMWNAANPGANQLTTFEGLKSLGTWGSKPGRVLDAGTQAQYAPNLPQPTHNNAQPKLPYRG